VAREIGRVKADLPKNMRHLAQQIQRLSVGFLQVNPKTIERYDSVVGEAATPFGGGDFASTTDSIFS
jgi:hypothetical protein